MQTNSTGRSYPAIALGGFLASVTGFILFKDVIDGAPINTTHALSGASLVVALAAFHMAWPCGRRRAYGSAVALALLGLAATAYIVVSSGARNAETAAAKVSRGVAANDARERALAAHREARESLANARAAKAKECSTGRGKLCREAEDLLAMAESSAREAANVPVGAAVIVNAGYAHAARVLEAMGLGSAGEIERRLELLLPFLAVLIVELGTVTFLHVGMGVPVQVPEKAVVPSVPHVEPAPEPIETDNVVSWVREFRARHGRNPQIPELQRVWDVPKTTAWRRIKSA